MVPLHILLLILGAVIHIKAIMVPTGKIGGITPPKMSFIAPLPRAQYREPAAVWERVDEGDNPYTPPIYKYMLWDYVQKYGHHTLIARDEDYYNPQQARIQPVMHYFYKKNDFPQYGKNSQVSYSKANTYYSPLQNL